MTENRQRPVTDELSLIIRWKLRKDREAADLINSLGWLVAEQTEKDQRVGDFEWVNQRLNELTQITNNLPPEYRNVGLLAQDLNGRKIPLLEEAREEFYSSKETARIVSSTIDKAVSEYPAWAKINPKYPSHGTPASGALIEGYGSFIGYLVSGGEGDTQKRAAVVSRHYVLAFEAVLINERPDSPLIRDVIGWMVEEGGFFPENLQPKIIKMAEGFNIDLLPE